LGKQKTSILKRKAAKLYELYPEIFSDDFNKNKEALKKLNIFKHSKGDRNMVAGFLVNVHQRRQKEIQEMNRKAED
jgi:ribosomal protein S17E